MSFAKWHLTKNDPISYLLAVVEAKWRLLHCSWKIIGTNTSDFLCTNSLRTAYQESNCALAVFFQLNASSYIICKLEQR